MKSALFALVLGLVASPAPAQLNLPRLPSLPRLNLPEPVNRITEATTGVLAPRADRIRDLLRAEPQRLERDEAGAPLRRGELLLFDPRPAWREAALALGFEALRELTLPALGEQVLVLRAPPGLAAADALRRLRAIDPALVADLNHLYLPGGAGGAEGTAPVAADPGAAVPLRVGLVDAGVAGGGEGLQRHGCDGRILPSAHGTAVAALLAGGAGPGVVYAADVYCGEAVGGDLASLASAFGWLAASGVGVINVSLVGPPNAGLQRLVTRLLERGHALVAAVGNDGPAAPPLYPAAYPGVVAVTALDARGRVLPEAGRGEHVAFAAPGVAADLPAPGGRRQAVRGTSFAAPRVARRLAIELAAPAVDARERALQRLVAEALDLGAAGRDPVYGFGALAQPPDRAAKAR